MRYLYSFIFVIYSTFIYSAETCLSIGDSMHHKERKNREKKFARENNLTIVFTKQKGERSRKLFRLQDGRKLALDILIRQKLVKKLPCSYCSAILSCNHYYEHQAMHRMRKFLENKYPDRRAWTGFDYLSATAAEYKTQIQEKENTQ